VAVLTATEAEAPPNLSSLGLLLGTNMFRNIATPAYMAREDRQRHFYIIGQTGTGKTTLMLNMVRQDIEAGEGVCFIDPHGETAEKILRYVPPGRMRDVIYFNPADTDFPFGLNFLEYDQRFPEQKTFVVNELFSIFQKLYGAVPESMGPAFEQYFRNATMLVIDDPSSGATLLDVQRVLADKEFRDYKLSRTSNVVVQTFWRQIAEKAGGEASLQNMVPYVTNKFDAFLANEIMRPVIAQQTSSFNFRTVMDEGKILIINLSKGRLGELNSALLGLILVGKLLMAALSRVEIAEEEKRRDFYLYIDEFQNVTTPSIATILSEARKYRLNLVIAHQFIAQLDEKIKNAVFGNVGTIAAFRVGAEDAEFLAKQFEPVFNASDLINIDNRNAYLKLLIGGQTARPFSIKIDAPAVGDSTASAAIKEFSRLTYGRPRAQIEADILRRYKNV
jgi:type IV secretory pathway TraG/TraD family ATPase VirD4